MIMMNTTATTFTGKRKYNKGLVMLWSRRRDSRVQHNEKLALDQRSETSSLTWDELILTFVYFDRSACLAFQNNYNTESSNCVLEDSVHFIHEEEYNEMVKTLLGDPLEDEDALMGDIDCIFDEEVHTTMTPSTVVSPPSKKQRILKSEDDLFSEEALRAFPITPDLFEDCHFHFTTSTTTSMAPTTISVTETVRSSSPAPSVTSTTQSVNSSSHNEERWNERYTELVEYKVQYGNCNVPYNWPSNRTLSQWVKRQRHQYKLRQEEKHSNLTQERQELLDQLSFVWDSRACHWEDRFGELVAFHKKFGHCRVTQTNKSYRPLAIWLKRQRHQSRLYLEGDQSTGMTMERMMRLVNLGVKLNVPQSKKP